VPGGAPQVLGGPIWWLVVGVYVGTLVLSVFVLVDSLRPVRRAAAELRLPEPLSLYTAGEAVFLALALVVWFEPVVKALPWLGAVPVLLVPLAIALGVAYLLRVVFPKPPSGAGDVPDARSETHDDEPLDIDGSDEES